jgi:hypothetical protein
VVAIFLELAVVVELIELPETRIELLRRLPRWLWLLELLHCDWIWLRLMNCGCQKLGRNWFDIVEAMFIVVFSCWIIAMFFFVSGHASVLWPLP